MNKYSRKIKLVFNIVLNSVLIFSMLFGNLDVVKAQTPTPNHAKRIIVNIEDPDNCTLAIDDAPITARVLSMNTAIAHDNVNFVPTSGPYANWFSDVNYDTSDPTKNPYGWGNQKTSRGWTGFLPGEMVRYWDYKDYLNFPGLWDYLEDLYRGNDDEIPGLSDDFYEWGCFVNGGADTSERDAILFSEYQSGNSVKLHRRKVYIPKGQYVYNTKIDIWADNSYKLWINGKEDNLSTNNSTTLTGDTRWYLGDIDSSGFFYGDNLIAFSVWNSNNPVKTTYYNPTGLTYYMVVNTAYDSVLPTVTSVSGLGPNGGWNKYGDTLTISGEDTGGSGLFHTYGSYNQVDWYLADIADPGINDKNWDFNENGVIRHIYNSTKLKATQNDALYCRSLDRAGNWSNITPCGSVKIDGTAPTINSITVQNGNTIVAQASDNIGGSGVKSIAINARYYSGEIYSNECSSSSNVGISSCSITVDEDQVFTVRAKATDYAGNTPADFTTRTVSVDTVKPNSPIVQSVNPSEIVSGIPTKKKLYLLYLSDFSDAEPSSGFSKYEYQWYYDDITKSFPTIVKSSSSLSTTIEGPIPEGATSISNGQYRLFVQSIDKNGNKSSTEGAIFTYIYDTVYPTLPSTAKITDSLNRFPDANLDPTFQGTNYNDPVFKWAKSSDPTAQYDIYWLKANTDGTCPAVVKQTKEWTKSDYTTDQTTFLTHYYKPNPVDPTYATWKPSPVTENGSWCLSIYPVDQAGNSPSSPKTFKYIYNGGFKATPVITEIVTTDAVGVAAYSESGGDWVIGYGPYSTGSITVKAKTGQGDTGLPLFPSISQLTFPDMFGAAAYNATIITPDKISQVERTYSITGSQANIEKDIKLGDAPTGYEYVAPKIKLIKDTTPPMYSFHMEAQNGVAADTAINSFYVSDKTSGIKATITVADDDLNTSIVPGGIVKAKSVTCPVAFGKTATFDATRTDNATTTTFVCEYGASTFPPPPDQTTYAFQISDGFNNVATRNVKVLVDSEAPSAPVVDLPDHPGAIFFASWKSSDNAGGSGIREYNVRFVKTGAPCDPAINPDNIATIDDNVYPLALLEKMEFVAYPAYPKLCVKVVDRTGNASWSTTTEEIGSVTSETFYHSFGEITAIERRDSDGNEDLTFALVDHLSSNAMTVRANGDIVSNVRYYPFGEERWSDVDVPTDRGYTGQRNEAGFGLIDYNARYYSPYLNRFLSPDDIVPDPYNPLDYDRYAYTRNNPIMYNDPTGHYICEDSMEGCDPRRTTYTHPDQRMLVYLLKNQPTSGRLSTKFGHHNTFKKDADVPKGSDDEKIGWMKSIDPGTGRPIGAHAGVDIYNREGTQLWAVGDGKVVGIIANSTRTAPGYAMIIEHTIDSRKYYAVYFHIQAETYDSGSTYQPVTGLSVGSTVSAGDTVAHMGNTGTSDVHLHFEVRRPGGVLITNGVATLDNSNGYWLSDPSQLNTTWFNISPAFGGYDSWYPKSWIKQ